MKNWQFWVLVVLILISDAYILMLFNNQWDISYWAAWNVADYVDQRISKTESDLKLILDEKYYVVPK
jgi:hypothetical protein